MLETRSHLLLVAFLVALTAMNVWRFEVWGADALIVYLTHPIMQTTLFDFACILGILVIFIRRDAKKHGLTWWWILPFFPFMPTIGVLLYFVVRRRRLKDRGDPII